MSRSLRTRWSRRRLGLELLERRALLVCGGLSSFGDATGDGQVDLNDHAVMRVQFGASTEPEFPVLTADFNDDCSVNLTDLNILTANFWTRPGGTPAPTGNVGDDLTLEYDAGAFWIRNNTGASISFSGYTIADPAGRLSTEEWDNLSNDTAILGPGASSFLRPNPTPTGLSEINLLRVAVLDGGASVSLGNPFPGANPAELGDVSFMFLRAGSMTAEGSNVIAPTGSPVGTPMDVDAADNVVAEDASPGAMVGITAFAAEPDASDTVVYILDNDAGGLFAIDATSGIVTLNGSVDYEGVRHFDIVVRAMSTDGSSSTASFGIDVSDLDEFDISSTVDQDDAPNVAAEDSVEGQSVGITAFAIDADGSAVLSYSLDDDADGLFTIHADTGVVMLASPLNYEMATSHTIVARSTSSDGSSTVAAWMIDVLDVDEFDVGLVADQDAAANAVLENSAVGTSVGIVAFAVDEDGSASVSYSLADDAGGLFAIDPTTGAVTVAGAVDFESADSHAVTVRGESTDGSFSTEQFTIDVLDVDEFDVTPIVDQDGGANLVAENSAPGTPVGITAFAEDEDGSDAVFYSLEDDAGGLFAIDASTGVVSVAGELDYEIAVSHAITILATSTDGSSQSLVAVIDIENELEPPGDTDGNNVVDVSDLNNVRNTFGESGPGVLGDTNGDNRVDIEDLNAVRNNFGAGQSEPTRAERSVPRGVSAIGRASTSNVGQDRSWQQATDALFHGYDQQLLEALVDLEAKPMSRRAQVLPWRGPATRVRQLKPAVAELFVPSLVSTSAS